MPRLLTSNEEKVRLIEELGPDELIMLPFDEQMAALTPAEFCAGLLAGSLQAKAVVVGENFNFGARGAGDAAQLRACGAANGYDVEVCPLVTEHGEPISSTRIRRLLHDGELEEVREILGRPPSAAGLVAHGDKRGRTLGVPTANVDVEAGTIFPGRGVYAARAFVAGSWYRAAVNIGHNPTFQSREEPTTHVTVEAFLLAFSGDIYEREIRLDFLHKIRDERRFDSVDALVAADAPRHRGGGVAHGPGARRRRSGRRGLTALRLRRARFLAAARCATLARPSSRSRAANPRLGFRILPRGR